MRIIAALLVGLSVTPAAAQSSCQTDLSGCSGSMQFHVAPVQGNPPACKQLDTAIAHTYTLAVVGDIATLKMEGGGTSNMKQSSRKVFTGSFSIGGTNFNAVANLKMDLLFEMDIPKVLGSKEVNTLTITDPKTNCRWSAFFHGFHEGPGLHESY